MKTIKITIEFLDTFDTTIKSTMLEKIAQFKKNGDLAFENNKRIKEGILDKMIDPIRRSLNAEVGEDIWIRPTQFKFESVKGNLYFCTHFKPKFNSKVSVVVGVRNVTHKLGSMEYKEFDSTPTLFMVSTSYGSPLYSEITMEEFYKVHNKCEAEYLQYFINNSN